MAVVGDGVLFPDFVASDCVERDQPAIIGADENLAFVERDATVDDIAAAFVALLAIYSGIEAPDSLAGPRIDGADRFEIVAPHQSEIFDVVRVDLVELAETGLGIVEAVGRPVLRGRRVGLDRGAVCADSDAETFNTLCYLLGLQAHATEFMRCRHKSVYILPSPGRPGPFSFYLLPHGGQRFC